MDIIIIAEGVEKDYQASALKHLDVEMAQGWFFSRPLKAEELIDFCEKNEKLLHNTYINYFTFYYIDSTSGSNRNHSL